VDRISGFIFVFLSMTHKNEVSRKPIMKTKKIGKRIFVQIVGATKIPPMCRKMKNIRNSLNQIPISVFSFYNNFEKKFFFDIYKVFSWQRRNVI